MLASIFFIRSVSFASVSDEILAKRLHARLRLHRSTFLHCLGQKRTFQFRYGRCFMTSMFSPMAARLHIKIAATGFIGAISIILIGFFSFIYAPPVGKFVWSVGMGLVAVSDKLCPPSAAVCVFGSDSQGGHHLWFFVCLFVGWWALTSTIAWLIAKYGVTRPASTKGPLRGDSGRS